MLASTPEFPNVVCSTESTALPSLKQNPALSGSSAPWWAVLEYGCGVRFYFSYNAKKCINLYTVFYNTTNRFLYHTTGHSTQVHTRAQYEEYGPSICRHNPVFSAITM